MSLEHLTQKLFHVVKKSIEHTTSTAVVMLETAVHHPFVTGAFTALTTAELNKDSGEVQSLAAFAAVGGYVACKLVQDYFYPTPEQPPTSLVDRAQHTFYQNITPLGLGLSIGAFTAMEASPTTDGAPFLAMYSVINSVLQLQRHRHNFNKTSTPRTLVDKILEHPLIPSTLVGAAVFYHYYQQFGYGYAHAPGHTLTLNLLLAQAALAATYVPLFLASTLFHSQSTLYAGLKFRLLWHKLLKDYARAHAVLNQLETVADRTTIDLEKAELLIREGKYEAGMFALRDNLVSPSSSCIGQVEYLQRLTGIQTLFQLAQFFLAIPTPHHRTILELGLLSFKDRRTATADYYLNIAALQTHNIDNKVLYLLFLATTCREQQAGEQLQHLIEFCPPDGFTKIAHSSDEVFVHNSTALTRTIVFKKSSRSLSQEYDASQQFYTGVSDKDAVAQPIAHARLQSVGEYLAQAYIKGTALVEHPDAPRLLENVLVFLAEVTLQSNEGKLRGAIPPIDYATFFYDKFVSRITTDPEQRKELMKVGHYIAHILSEQEPEIIHGNPHPGNILVRSDINFTLLDFGDACKATFGLDLEHATATLAPTTPRIPHYELSIRIRKQKPTKTTLQQYSAARVLKAAHLLGRSIHYTEGDTTVYKDNLVDAISELKTLSGEHLLLQRFMDSARKIEI